MGLSVVVAVAVFGVLFVVIVVVVGLFAVVVDVVVGCFVFVAFSSNNLRSSGKVPVCCTHGCNCCSAACSVCCCVCCCGCCFELLLAPGGRATFEFFFAYLGKAGM